ncbi:hypothetical protein GE09DRAFT_1136222 [Coniochaeta sp. 2T2.1]|nr:hypothetical protein GE09DRAFT_1136222 [Coniochaeta sp. 2T2.1]
MMPFSLWGARQFLFLSVLDSLLAKPSAEIPAKPESYRRCLQSWATDNTGDMAECLSSSDTVFVVVGITGSGKSTVISTLTGQDSGISHDLVSCKCTSPVPVSTCGLRL